jgi:inner membrane transporter RhtA
MRASGPLLVVGAAVSVQVGAAFAKNLFGEVGPPAVVLMRLVFGSVAVWAIFRPRFAGRTRRELGLVVALGFVIAGMNNSFYESLDRIPLGVAVTIEFLGPLAVAVLSSHRRLDFVWIALAAGGIVLLADASGGLSPAGVALAGLAAVFWGVYILLGVRVGKLWPGASGLAVAMVVGAVLSIPGGLATGHGHLLHPGVLASGLVVAIACSALPWSLEIEAMRRLPTHVFGVLMSIEPAIAALSGLVVLGEHLSLHVAIAIALVVVASAGAALGARDPELPVDA